MPSSRLLAEAGSTMAGLSRCAAAAGEPTAEAFVALRTAGVQTARVNTTHGPNGEPARLCPSRRTATADGAAAIRSTASSGSCAASGRSWSIPRHSRSPQRKGTASFGAVRRDGRSTCQGLATLAPHNRPNWVDYTAKPVVRGGIEPPAFRFSGISTALPDDAGRGLTGNLAAETNVRYRPAWPGVCRCWLPFGSPFGSP
jgi:hypothetical protein